MSELQRHAEAFFALLRLQTKAIDRFDPSPAAAWRSCRLLAVILPLQLFAAWVGDRSLIEHHTQYLALRGLQVVVSVVLPLLPVWLLCRSQDMAARFPLFVTTQNWLYLFWAVFGAALNGLTADTPFPVEFLMKTSTVLFFVHYASVAYFAGLALRCNLLVAIGVATIPNAIMAISNDALNLYLFGIARPLIGQ